MGAEVEAEAEVVVEEADTVGSVVAVLEPCLRLRGRLSPLKVRGLTMVDVCWWRMEMGL